MRKTITALEGLRGAAALFVVLYHAFLEAPWLGFARGGYLSVDLFFVLSGFVICSAYGRSLEDGTQLRIFMIRRFGRLWPTHVATTVLSFVLVNCIVAGVALTGSANLKPVIPSISELVTLLTMSQGLHTLDHLVGTKVAWSAGDEFYVYVLFGAICLWVRGRTRAVTFLALATIGYAVTIWAALGPYECLTRPGCMSLTYDYGWARCLVGFFAGALIAEFRDAALFRALRAPIMQTAAFLIALALVISVDLLPGVALASPVVFFLLIAALSAGSGPVSSLFDLRPFQYLGRISYSLYLGHGVFLPLLLLLRAAHDWQSQAEIVAVFMALSIGLAHVLYLRVEAPYRAKIYAWSDRFRGDASSPASAG
ncbi:acyltransferase [Burkholderia stagnalis]|uniref:acyltransferase family protein n=1 Tax=Burkholderia stagnalis TaxID=1503054 RepID=UPI000F5F345C|nr:acyltransferase [Burkholderia stagnalis]RQZ08885.1 acyltransferase [Burkholderia stagnalis]